MGIKGHAKQALRIPPGTAPNRLKTSCWMSFSESWPTRNSGCRRKKSHYLLYVEVLPHVEIVGVPPGPAVVTADPADDMFLHCAVKARASCIVSGDRHLFRLNSYKRIKILSPSEFLSRRARS